MLSQSVIRVQNWLNGFSWLNDPSEEERLQLIRVGKKTWKLLKGEKVAGVALYWSHLQWGKYALYQKHSVRDFSQKLWGHTSFCFTFYTLECKYLHDSTCNIRGIPKKGKVLLSLMKSEHKLEEYTACSHSLPWRGHGCRLFPCCLLHSLKRVICSLETDILSKETRSTEKLRLMKRLLSVSHLQMNSWRAFVPSCERGKGFLPKGK